MKIVIVRHGESEMNSLNKKAYQMFSGQTNSSLTDLGIEQARKLKGCPEFQDIQCVYSSDLIRAYESASYAIPNHKPIKTPLLRERSLGIFEGKTVKEIQGKSEYKKYFEEEGYKNFRHSFNVSAPDGEHYGDVYKRVEKFFSEFVNKQYESYAIFSHQTTIRCILKYLLKLSNEETLRIRVPNCLPIVIESNDGLRYKITKPNPQSIWRT